MRRPSDADQELAELADSGGLIEFRLASGNLIVPAGASQIFAFWNQAGGKEGLVIGLSFFTASQDYATNPVTVGTASFDSVTSNLATAGVNGRDTIVCAVGQRGQPMMVAGGRRGYSFGQGKTPVLAVKNGSGGPLAIEGYMQLLVWDPKDRAEAFERVGAWKGKTSGPFGGERLFGQ